MSFID